MTDKQTDIKTTVTGIPTPSATQDALAEQPTLKEVIKSQTASEDTPLSAHLTFGRLLGGDILNTSTIRRQIWLFLLVVVFIILYISNRYSCQQSLIEIDKLQKELLDAKYKAQATGNKLTELSRESNVLDMLKANNDSTLKMPTQPPYLITVPEK